MSVGATAIVITPEALLGEALAAALRQGAGSGFDVLVAPTPLDAGRDDRSAEAGVVLYDGVAYPEAARTLRDLFPRATLVVIAPPGQEPLIERELAAGAGDYLLRDAGGAYLRLLALRAARARESAGGAGSATTAPASLGRILRLEESLRRSEIRYGHLVQAIPDIVYQLDPQGNFVFLNAAVSTLDYGPQELLGRHFSAIVHPDDLPFVSREHVIRRRRDGLVPPDGTPKLFDERRSGDRRTRGLMVRLMAKPGGPAGAAHRIGDVVSYGVIEAMGRYEPGGEEPSAGESFRGTVGIIHDVTLHRRSEEMIRVLLQAVDQSPVGIVVLDQAGAVEYVNPLFLRESRLLPEEVIGRRAALLTESGSLGSLFAILGDTAARGAEWRGRLPAGPARPLPWRDLYVSPVRDPLGRTTHFIAVLTLNDVEPGGGAGGRR